jgi:outer membrane receptor protein involved in Fe transport
MVFRGLFLSTLSIFVLASPDAHASPKEDKHGKEYETVVSASRVAEKHFDSPREVEVVPQRRMRELAASTTPEALEHAAGVIMQRTNGAGGAPIIRGLLGQHVLLLVDGIRLNTAITRFGPNQLLNTVNPFSIRRAEVLYGPGSVLYGSDAIGGVVNLVTYHPEFDPWRAWDANGEFVSQVESASGAIALHGAASGHLRSYGARIGGTFRRFFDLRAGRSRNAQPFTSFWEGDLDASFAWIIDKKTSVRLWYSMVRQHDAPRTDRSQADDYLVFRDQLRDLVALSFSHELGDKWPIALSARASLHSQRELRERVRDPQDRLDRENDDVTSIGLSLSATAKLPFNRLSAGFDFYHDIVASSAERETISSDAIILAPRGRYVDGSLYTQLAGYVNDRLSLLDGRLSFDLGGRINHWIAAIDADPLSNTQAVDENATALVGSFHARYRFGDGVAISAGVNQGFRAPNIDDYSARGCSGQGYDVPNSELGPERSITAEAGLKLDLFGLLTGRVFYHYTRLSDVIVRRVVAGEQSFACGGSPLPVTRRENANTATIHGVDTRLALSFGRFRVFGWLAWNYGKVDIDGTSEPLGRVPPLSGVIGLRYKNPGKFFSELALRWSLRQDRLSSSDRVDRRICPEGAQGCEGTAAFATLSWRTGIWLRENVRLLAVIDNVTDQRYRIHGSGLDGPGINASASLELRR